MDSVPLVVLTGQTITTNLGKDAFQEADVFGVTMPVVKHSYLVRDVDDLPRIMNEAFHLAISGRPGPVLVDLPKDVVSAECNTDFTDELHLPGYNPPGEAPEEQVSKAADPINQAQRPVILAGHGVLISQAYRELRELAEKAQIPVVTTLLGISSLPSSHYLNLGMAGMHGLACASLAINESDLLISLGMRFDDRVTGRLKDFAPNARVVHVDIDPSELDKNVKADAPVAGDLKQVLNQLLPKVDANVHIEWLRYTDNLRVEHPSTQIRETQELLPQYVLNELSKAANGEALIVTGVGQHQMWAAQYCEFQEPNTLITSGGLGTMGFEVPAALGAKLGRPEKTIWSVAGDGGFQMTMCDLATAVENNADIKFAILNNGRLGMVHQLQDLSYDRNHFATIYSGNPDFVKLAEAYGIAGIRVTEKERTAEAIQQAMETPGPVIVDFMVRETENVFPWIPAGESVNEMLEETSPGKVGEIPS